MSAENLPSKLSRLLIATSLMLSLKSSNVRPETSSTTQTDETKKISLTKKDFLPPPIVIFRSPTPSPTPTFTPTSTPFPTPTSMPAVIQSPYPTQEIKEPEIVLSFWEEKMYQAIQELRKERNLPLLKLSPDLIRIAQERSLDMATRNYFSHDTPEDQKKVVLKMLDQTGVYYPYAGENLTRTNLNQIEEAAQEIMKRFLESPGHSRNLLRPQFSLIGIGYAFSEEDNLNYITIIFTSLPR